MTEAAFVTGGSGFIGGRLIERLVGEGTTVRALARSDPAAERVAALGAEAVHGDIGHPASLESAAEGANVAFHLAAHVAEFGPWEDFEQGNFEGTRNVLAACAEAGVSRFVHCGTEAVLMAGEPLVQVDETAPLRPDSPAPYSATKAKAERAVREASRDEFETVVVRPRFVWGVGDTTVLPALVETVEAGKWAWIGDGRNLTETTHVDNVVEGLLLAAKQGRPGEAYFVTDGEPIAFREMVAALLTTRGIVAPDRTLPAWTAAPLARVSEAAWRLLPLKGEPPLTRFRSWILTQECTIDISKARQELGYAPIVTRDQGLAQLRGAA